MTYREAIAQACQEYARDERVRFLGYNVKYGSKMYGTLNDIADGQLIETPVAEGLMVGMAVGMTLRGLLPVVCFERHDFLLLGLDELVNQVDKINELSGNQFKVPIVFRCIVGAKRPLYPGPQHTQDYSNALAIMLNHTPLELPFDLKDMRAAFAQAGQTESGAIVIIEQRGYYDLPVPDPTEKPRGPATVA